jgi:hypothetical protein
MPADAWQLKHKRPLQVRHSFGSASFDKFKDRSQQRQQGNGGPAVFARPVRQRLKFIDRVKPRAWFGPYILSEMQRHGPQLSTARKSVKTL